jgi:RimJ/RimL family protein N-acetyltransferase
MKLLPIEHYDRVALALHLLTVNYLFARFVVERKIEGKIYVDDIDHPTAFYVAHPYSMSLLFGNAGNEAFNEWLKEYILNTDGTRKRHEWLQAPEEKWQTKLAQLFGDRFVSVEENNGAINDKIEVSTRVNFKFNKEKFLAIKAMSPIDKQVVRTEMLHYDAIPGTVIPQYFWNNSDDFFASGVGFSFISDDQVASTAFSAFIFDGVLEIGIETAASLKGQGHAFAACSTLIDYCIAHNYEPVWGCKKNNIGSYRLACRLGFEPTITLPYYRLNY